MVNPREKFLLIIQMHILLAIYMQIFVHLGGACFQYFRFNQNNGVVNFAAILDRKWNFFDKRVACSHKHDVLEHKIHNV